jgi:molybdopterin molybdotransferase
MSVDLASARILADFERLSAEEVSLLDALGRVLAEDIIASHAIPPFANSSMDGYAVRTVDLGAANTLLRVVDDITAGAPPPQRRLMPGEAARIMTGAPIPHGADAVVPMEQTDQPWRSGEQPPLPAYVTIRGSVKAGAFIRPVGEDIQAGQVVMTSGRLLMPAEIGVLAALGRAAVSVIRRPRVVIISTGDELIEVGEPLAPGKIYDANGYSLYASSVMCGAEAIRLPIAHDNLDDTRARFREALEHRPDVILSSAGVSVGTVDVVKTVLNEMGEIGFWKVNLRPGKPLAYGRVGGIPFFGLPGNPVSAMVTFELFVRPALLKLGGRPDDVQTVRVIAGEPIQSDGRRSYLRAILRRDGDQWIAALTGTQSSGALTSMISADALVIVPEGITNVAAGTMLDARLLRPVR